MTRRGRGRGRKEERSGDVMFSTRYIGSGRLGVRRFGCCR